MGHSLLKNKLLILLGGDVFLTLVAIFAAFVLRFGPAAAFYEINAKPLLNLVIAVLVITLVSLLLDVYDLSQNSHKRQIITNSLLNSCISFALLTMIYYLSPGLILGRGLLISFLVFFAVSQFFWHVLFCLIFENPLLARKVLIIGTDSIALKIGQIIDDTDYSLTHRLVGYLDHGEVPTTDVAKKGSRWFHSADGSNLLTIVLANKVAEIVVTAANKDENSSLLQNLINCKLMGVEIFDGQSFFERMTGKLMLEDIDSTWLLFSAGFKNTIIINMAKRIIDVSASLCGLVVALPLLPMIALLVKVNSPGPIFYSQNRVGQWGTVFKLFKFRTMPVNAEEECGAVWSQQNDQRIRPIGRFLRKWRFDEIPQLFNILRGDMSLIGPRPERPEFVESLSKAIPHYAKRHFIKPGLTGWAQVRFPYGSSIEDSYEKLRYDLYYFKNMSPVLDTIIFLKTFKVVLFGFGGR